MRELTATEAARNFARVLDDAAEGEVIVITRQGERVAQITPAPRANGAAILALANRWSAGPPRDDALARAVTEIREESRRNTKLNRDPWQD